MMISVQVYDEPGGMLIDDWSDARGHVIKTGEHGFWTYEAFIRMSQSAALEFFGRDYRFYVMISYGGLTVWEGRIEDMTLKNDGLQITAFGLWSVMSDSLLTVLWSDSGYAEWFELNDGHNTEFDTERHELDNNNRLLIAVRKDEQFEHNNYRGGWGYSIPDKSERQITGIEFDYEMKGSSDWYAAVRTADSSWDRSTTNQWVLQGNGTTQTGTISKDWSSSPTDNVCLEFYFYSATPTTFTGETGTAQIKLTDIRVKTTNASTITGKDIVDHLIDYVSGINSLIKNCTALVDDPGIDLDTFIAEDARPSAIGDDMAALGDDTDNLPWEIGVYEDRRVHFRHTAHEAAICGIHHRLWYATVSEVEIDRSMTEVANSVYTVYSGDNNRRVRTARAQDLNSIKVLGITREEYLTVSTTSQTRAEAHRDIYLNDRQHVEPKAILVLDNITDCHGGDFDYWEPRAGDFVYIVNLPPEKPELDLIRSFRIRTTEYKPGTEYSDGSGDLLESLVLTPLELPLLDVIVARSQAGAGAY